jgi:CBS domain-containing protein
MLTDRDIAVRSTANGNDPKSTHVRDIMTENIEFCFEDDDIERIKRKMTRKKIRRLMVMRHDKRMTGILSIGDIAAESPGSLRPRGLSVQRSHF